MEWKKLETRMRVGVKPSNHARFARRAAVVTGLHDAPNKRERRVSVKFEDNGVTVRVPLTRIVELEHPA